LLLIYYIQTFPSIHTEIEWSIFDNSDGFQAWYLYDNKSDIGNMFLIDTEYVLPSSYLVYNEDKSINLNKQCSNENIKIFNNFNYLEKVYIIYLIIDNLNADIL
jgi:hypothetical protein